MKTNLLITILLITFSTFAQRIVSKNKLIIKHKDITLYLSSDTCSMVSKHVISYKNIKQLDNKRDNKWFRDIYKSKCDINSYLYTGYDLGHLTPSHITSYNDTINHYSFSLYNQAPQLAKFNRGKWMSLESTVEKIIENTKRNAIVTTGVIYDYNHPIFLDNSKIRIPIAFYKILVINKKTYCWIGSNINGEIIETSVPILNDLFAKNGMVLKIIE